MELELFKQEFEEKIIKSFLIISVMEPIPNLMKIL